MSDHGLILIYGDIFREATQSKLFYHPSEKVSTLKGKNLLPKFFPCRVDTLWGSKFFPCRVNTLREGKFFPFRVDFFSELASCAGMQLGTHKSYHSCINDEKSIRNIKSPKASEKTIINISNSVSGEFLETYAIFDKELLFT